MTTAADRAAAVALARERIAAGTSRAAAVRDVAARVGVGAASLRRWLERAEAAAAEGAAVIEAVADRARPGRPPRVWSAPGAEDAWQVWRGLYLSLSAPPASVCWHRTREIAALRGWSVPPAKTFMRRLRAELPARDVIRAREGRLPALQTFPFLARSVEGVKPLEAVSGDGYRHDLLVIPPDGGKPIRPVTWTWQDVRTRRLLAHRSGPTESADLVRTALWDLCTNHGAPRALVLDNTRAASAGWLGGPTVRWRRDREDAPTVFHSLGIPVRVIRTGVERTAGGRAAGRGWAKPVERAHRDYGDWIDSHPLAEGASTGRSTATKPEDHGTRPLDWETFIRIVDDDVRALNALPGRRTEACGGRLSFDQAWEREIATTPVTRLSPAQAALLLMAAESTAVQRSGAFTLRLGAAIGMGRNRYYHPDLVAWAGKRVVARIDPSALHAGAAVFEVASGRWICDARWLPSAGFGDVEAAADHNRARRAGMRDLDRAHEQRDRARDIYAAHAAPRLAAAPAPGPRPKVVRMVPDGGEARPDAARTEALRRRLSEGLRAVNED